MIKKVQSDRVFIAMQCTNVFCQNENKTPICLENILKSNQIPYKVAIIINHLYYI